MIVESAPAKLNLALHVRGRRVDGYHELDTLFAFARDGDTVTVAPAGEDSFEVTGPYARALHYSVSSARGGEPPAKPVVKGASNLVIRAAAAFRTAIAIAQPYAIRLDKHLPIASGIGGGSADAAATLRALARLHGLAPDDARLVTAAAGLGADVPACLLGRTARGTGRGDRLTRLLALGDVPALLVNPNVAVSTAEVFAGWDGIDHGPIAGGDPLAAARGSNNALTAAAIAVAPVIADVLAALDRTAGHRLVRMSGSGATCFALYASPDARASAAAAIRAAQPGWWCLETALA